MRKRIALVLLVLGFMLECYGTRPHAQNPNLTWIATVDQAQNETYDNMQFFQLKRKDEAPLLTVQGNTELAAFLRQADGKRVIITIEIAGKLER